MLLQVVHGDRSCSPPEVFMTAAAGRPGNGGEVSPDIVAAARRGDARAFEIILRHYDRRLRIIAGRLLDDRPAMDDVLQEVAIKALRGLPAYRGEAPLGAWLCLIATTTCLDHLRRRRPEDPTAPEELPELEGAWPDPADELSDRERLGAALRALPAEQRVAVTLVDQFGYDYARLRMLWGCPWAPRPRALRRRGRASARRSEPAR